MLEHRANGLGGENGPQFRGFTQRSGLALTQTPGGDEFFLCDKPPRAVRLQEGFKFGDRFRRDEPQHALVEDEAAARRITEGWRR